MAGKMRENRLRWFGRVGRRNNNDLVKTGEIRTEENRGTGSKPK